MLGERTLSGVVASRLTATVREDSWAPSDRDVAGALKAEDTWSRRAPPLGVCASISREKPRRQRLVGRPLCVYG